MERLRGGQDGKRILAPNLYSAYSIRDMNNSEDVIVQEKKREIAQWEKKLKGIPRIVAFSNIRKAHEMMESSAIITAVISLPPVWHFPQSDNPKHQDAITVFDSTGALEVRFPDDKNLKKLAKNLERRSGIKFDPRLLRINAWHNEIILVNSYEEKEEPMHFLVCVKEQINSRPTGRQIPQIILTPNPEALTI